MLSPYPIYQPSRDLIEAAQMKTTPFARIFVGAIWKVEIIILEGGGVNGIMSPLQR